MAMVPRQPGECGVIRVCCYKSTMVIPLLTSRPSEAYYKRKQTDEEGDSRPKSRNKRAGGWCKSGGALSEARITPESPPEPFDEVGAAGCSRYRTS